MSMCNIDTRPCCGSDEIAVPVRTYANFKAGEPDAFDPEDLDYVEPVEGGEAICRACQHTWSLTLQDIETDQLCLELAGPDRSA